jgi:hypothetical protein
MSEQKPNIYVYVSYDEVPDYLVEAYKHGWSRRGHKKI